MSKSEIHLLKDLERPGGETAVTPQRVIPGPTGVTEVSIPNSPAKQALEIHESHESHDPHEAQRRRPAWRQRLVQAERGLVRGVRSDSAFFVHFFGIIIVVAAALVFGIGWMQWIAIAGCLTLVLTAEMFNQALKALAHSNGPDSSPGVQRALAIGTAAVLVACIGSIVVLTLVFWQRFEQLFEG